MKNVFFYILTTSLLLLGTTVNAQKRDKNSQEKFIYTDVIAKYNADGYLRGFELDFGVLVDTLHADIVTMRKNWEVAAQRFESTVDAFNFMAQYGWGFVEKYTSEIQLKFSNATYTFDHWIFKKAVDSFKMMKK